MTICVTNVNGMVKAEPIQYTILNNFLVNPVLVVGFNPLDKNDTNVRYKYLNFALEIKHPLFSIEDRLLADFKKFKGYNLDKFFNMDEYFSNLHDNNGIENYLREAAAEFAYPKNHGSGMIVTMEQMKSIYKPLFEKANDYVLKERNFRI